MVRDRSGEVTGRSRPDRDDRRDYHVVLGQVNRLAHVSRRRHVGRRRVREVHGDLEVCRELESPLVIVESHRLGAAGEPRHVVSWVVRGVHGPKYQLTRSGEEFRVQADLEGLGARRRVGDDDCQGRVVGVTRNEGLVLRERRVPRQVGYRRGRDPSRRGPPSLRLRVHCCRARERDDR